jgi:DNA primase
MSLSDSTQNVEQKETENMAVKVKQHKGKWRVFIDYHRKERYVWE